MSGVAGSAEKAVQCLSASQLRKLPVEERNAILAAQAAIAEPIYRGDKRLTDFEAFGEDDLHGESSSTETG
jgi:hypothetical protein